MSKNVSSETSSEIPRWVWALALGVPVVASVAYIFLGGDGDEDNDVKSNKKKKSLNKISEKKVRSVPEHKSDDTVVKMESTEESIEDITDPLKKALAYKAKGNKYFKGTKYDSAVKCYTDAIESCPEAETLDLSTFYQNRAAAYDQLNDSEKVIEDCTKALSLNFKYVKALDRRYKAYSKTAEDTKDVSEKISLLKRSLVDLTSVCILSGFKNQSYMMAVETLIKELGKVEASYAMKHREPILAKPYFIKQFFSSFLRDPVQDIIQNGIQNGVHEYKGYLKAKECFQNEEYDRVIEACEEEIENSDNKYYNEAKVLRGTFYCLSKRAQLAMRDFTEIIENENVSVKTKVNALVKRASLIIQRVEDPVKDPELSFNDFMKALELDPKNPDIHHHMGQIHLLLDRTDSAIESFQRSVDIEPNYSVSQVQLLFTQYRKAAATDPSKKRDFISMFEELLKKFPKCIETHALFAQVLSDCHEFDRANDLYIQAQTLDKENANLLVHRGMIKLQYKGDIVEAVKLMEQAIELDDRCEFAFETLGTVEVQRGNINRAIELFDKAIPLSNSELELSHLFGLRDAAEAQKKASENLGISLSGS